MGWAQWGSQMVRLADVEGVGSVYTGSVYSEKNSFDLFQGDFCVLLGDKEYYSIAKEGGCANYAKYGAILVPFNKRFIASTNPGTEKPKALFEISSR